mgnify:FL=1
MVYKTKQEITKMVLMFKEAMVSPYYLIKDTIVTNIVRIPFLHDTSKFTLLEVFAHICRPQSLVDVMKFSAAL